MAIVRPGARQFGGVGLHRIGQSARHGIDQPQTNHRRLPPAEIQPANADADTGISVIHIRAVVAGIAVVVSVVIAIVVIVGTVVTPVVIVVVVGSIGVVLPAPVVVPVGITLGMCR